MFDQVQLARERLRGYAHVTPVVTSRTLNEMLGAKVFFKCENFQRVGAFKFRGAYNAMSRLSAAEQERGVIAYSSGNHAQAVALVGRMLGINTVVVMPAGVSAAKRAATVGYGAQVIDCDLTKTTREELAATLQTEHGYALIPPFDHPAVIAGQGTAALEFCEQAGPLNAMLAPVGGGGLLSGTAIATKGHSSRCRVIGVEPELANDATHSFQTKTLHAVNNPQTIADGTRTRSLGELTFPLILKYVDEMATVSESAIMEAVKFLFQRMKLVVEPSGALGLAALMSGAVKAEGRTGIILSGGNVDAATMASILES
ncbi:threo-3-hydroxy-L-aspartate ammonia-lyase [soil metagenome]